MSSDREDNDKDSSPEPEGEASNAFANDGSFLEMFKKRMEEQKRKEIGGANRVKREPTTATTETTKSTVSTTKPTLSSATGVQKVSVNKPYQVVHSFIT